MLRPLCRLWAAGDARFFSHDFSHRSPHHAKLSQTEFAVSGNVVNCAAISERNRVANSVKYALIITSWSRF
jgi:hypothetical protein